MGLHSLNPCYSRVNCVSQSASNFTSDYIRLTNFCIKKVRKPKLKYKNIKNINSYEALRNMPRAF